MQIIAIFAILVFVLNAIAMAICSIIEGYSPYASLIAFLGFFVVNFVIAWQLALYFTERFLLTDAQRREMDEQTRALRGFVR